MFIKKKTHNLIKSVFTYRVSFFLANKISLRELKPTPKTIIRNRKMFHRFHHIEIFGPSFLEICNLDRYRLFTQRVIYKKKSVVTVTVTVIPALIWHFLQT